MVTTVKGSFIIPRGIHNGVNNTAKCVHFHCCLIIKYNANCQDVSSFSFIFYGLFGY